MHPEDRVQATILRRDFLFFILDSAAATPGHPGLDVSFQNRGSNTLTGQFTIRDLTFSDDLATIATVVVDFEQHSEGLAPALFGHLEYNVAGLPEPSPLALLALLCGLTRTRTRPSARLLDTTERGQPRCTVRCAL